MPDFCTCGAELPPNAVFCHKCGKPQREIRAVEPEVIPEFTPPPTPAATAPVAAAEPPLTFRNRAAVRIALWVGLAATLLGMTILPFVNWLAAGFFAVFFYRKKTRRLLNVKSGAHLGWITGLVMFPMWAVAFAAQQIPEALSGRLGATLQQQMKSFSGQDPALQHQMAQFFQSGPGIAVMLLFSLAFLFLLIIGLSIAGGALGAKVSGRE
jgi:zinc-ribbon domain